jgi:[glutamine synthetase] adenylyltransferase / [glutamine synthetase]-adenylyl-L-tyrosine phosphorylase
MLDERLISGISFQNPDYARQHWHGLAGQLSAELTATLPGLLRDSPDPDAALLMVAQLLTECDEQVARLIEHHPPLLHYAVVVFGHSRFLGETLLRNPDLMQMWVRQGSLDRSYSRQDFLEGLKAHRAQTQETDLSTVLAQFKRREYVRIMLRDLLKIAPLAETTAEISSLADVLIAEALREAQARLLRKHPSKEDAGSSKAPLFLRFAVMSLGKLGGNELNYSSDVDLMYLFQEDEDEGPAQAHFIGLAQRVTDILSRVTREGAVFRVDLRLRPRGRDGELAVSLSQALRYYTEAAEDWERQALIKVRLSAGDAALARAFIRGVQPCVYTEKINFSAIKTALVARERMHSQKRLLRSNQDPWPIDIKINHGGIRDIEFLVQCLQRVYGGREPWLRSRGTLFALQKLHDKGHLSAREFQDLGSAYEFLRHLEHRLQLRHGRQTHELPSAQDELRIVHNSICGYDAAGPNSDLIATVQGRMGAVSEIYKRVIFQQQAREREVISAVEFALRGSVEGIASDESNQQILERLASESPTLHEIASRKDMTSVARRNLFRFLSSALTSSERYAAAIRQPEAVRQALRVFDASEYLTDVLVRHPEEIGTLAELQNVESRSGSGYLFSTPISLGQPTRDPVIDYLAGSTLPRSEKLALLRRHFRHRVLAEGARDLTGLRDVYSSLGAMTAAAEDAIASAFGIAGNPAGVAVMALGRFGTSEFDIYSDADLLFLCDEGAAVRGLARFVEGMTDALSSYTRDGMVFAVDTRLRPRGSEGELLITIPQLEAYFEGEAEEWEALLYTKLRFLTGTKDLAYRALRATNLLFERSAMNRNLQPALRAMRRKLEGTHAAEKNFKTMPGASYDIDFITGYLLVKHSIGEKNGTLRDRVWRCAAAGLLEKKDAARLDHAAELLRTAEHFVRLVVGRGGKWLPAADHPRRVIADLTGRALDRSFGDDLESELEATCVEVRGIYDRVLWEAS